MKETKLKTFIKALTYRIVALLITAIWTGLPNAVVIHVILTVVYYIHERIWIHYEME